MQGHEYRAPQARMWVRWRVLGVAWLVLMGGSGCRGAPDTVDLTEHLPTAEVARELRTIEFGMPAAREHLAAGWGPDERWSEERVPFVWAVGERSVMDVFIATPQPLTLTLRCWPFLFDGAPTQTIAVAVNGHRLTEVALQQAPAEYTVDVPPAALVAGRNRLTFRYAYSRRPVDVFDRSRDPRPLAVAWQRLVLAPLAEAPPLTARRDGATPALALPFGGTASYYLDLPAGSTLLLEAIEPWTAADGAAGGGQLEVRIDQDGSEARLQRIAPGGAAGSPVALAAVPDRPAKLTLRAVREGTPDVDALGLLLRRPRVQRLARDTSLPARCAARPPSAAAAGRPNVILYLIDTLRADHLGSYGYRVPTSPQLDAFARDAVRFAHAVAQAPWTKPAVASLFTGLLPTAHGAIGRPDVLVSAPTLASRLRDAGYQTAGIITNSVVAPEFGLGQGFDSYELLKEIKESERIHQGADRLNAQALAWLDARSASAPFFLYLHATDPHDPYAPPEPYRRRFAPGADLALGRTEFLHDLDEGLRSASETERRTIEALYNAEIAFVDEQFGILMHELRARGLYDSALIIVLSDHGEAFAEHGHWAHASSLYEEELRIPLFIKFPHQWAAGQTVGAVMQQVDVLPTIIDYLGIDAPRPAHGTSVLPALRCPEAAARRPIAFSHLGGAGIRFQMESVRDGTRKLIHDAAASFAAPQQELYDLAADPLEEHDLAEALPVEAGYLRTHLRAIARDARSAASAPPAQLDDALRERLRALGYLQ